MHQDETYFTRIKVTMSKTARVKKAAPNQEEEWQSSRWTCRHMKGRQGWIDGTTMERG
jgi:hypothetical protein